MSAIANVPFEVAQQIGHYVYALRDPRTKRVFYVGKGVDSRINAHVLSARQEKADLQAETLKDKTIREIEESGAEVEHLFLRTGLPDSETAYMVEQAVIDAFDATGHPLTNLVKGRHSSRFGLATLPVVVAKYRAEPCPPINEPVLMFKIQKGWRPDLSRAEIYEQTRGHWRIGAWVRERAQYAVGVAYGVIYGVYRIEGWFPSRLPEEQGLNRWGFDGHEAAELKHILGTHVRDAFPNRVMYRRFLDGYPGASQ